MTNIAYVKAVSGKIFIAAVKSQFSLRGEVISVPAGNVLFKRNGGGYSVLPPDTFCSVNREVFSNAVDGFSKGRWIQGANVVPDLTPLSEPSPALGEDETLIPLGDDGVPHWPAVPVATLDQTEPDQAEPDQTEPDQSEPDQAEPDQSEPDQAEPDQSEPDQSLAESAASAAPRIFNRWPADAGTPSWPGEMTRTVAHLIARNLSGLGGLSISSIYYPEISGRFFAGFTGVSVKDLVCSIDQNAQLHFFGNIGRKLSLDGDPSLIPMGYDPRQWACEVRRIDDLGLDVMLASDLNGGLNWVYYWPSNPGPGPAPDIDRFMTSPEVSAILFEVNEVNEGIRAPRLACDAAAIIPSTPHLDDDRPDDDNGIDFY